MKLISILRFEFKRWASLGNVALQSLPELRVLTQARHRDTLHGQRGSRAKGLRWGKARSHLSWIWCSFYLWSLGHYLSLFSLKQEEKATALEAGNGEAGTWSAGGPSQYRHGLLPRPLAGCLETSGFSRYSITHPAGVLPGYRPLCVASPWLL